jgi:peptidoglycan/xylan/chitin deacetylase (PgdA/CDA1 family)
LVAHPFYRAAAGILLAAIAFLGPCLRCGWSLALEPIPDKLVVLTFDDSSKSHFTVARPLLKQYRFGATFFITEGFDFRDNKRDYMTWEEIAELDRDGFEIGNHTRDHQSVTEKNVAQLPEQLTGIAARCREHGIPKPSSFAYPGNAITREAPAILKREGIRFARRGGAPEFAYPSGRGFAYEPGLDHPLLIPSAGDARPDWTLDDFVRAVSQARHGRIAVLQFHGVPDTAHSWVNSSSEQFGAYMKFLAVNKFQVIALRDLARYVDAEIAPKDPWGVIEDRKRQLAGGSSADNARRPKDEAELAYWLDNMRMHGFSVSEMSAATGLTGDEIEQAIRRLPPRSDSNGPHSEGRLRVLPYPGGRHPRIGFLDGALRPQRETKFSVFAPWPDGGYVVVDVPEAIWFKPGERRELLYLAHTHVPTYWDRKNVVLEPLEWKPGKDGGLEIERALPNQIRFGARVAPGRGGVRMALWVTNGSSETLTDLVVQNCVLLKGAKGFEDRTDENKVVQSPFVACHDRTGRRWVITAWQPCHRAWTNPPCPCMHSDPKFADCPPGQTSRVQGWLSFYEGADITAELARLATISIPEAQGK